MIRYVPVLVVLGVWIYAFTDCLSTPERQVRRLPKGAWLLVTLLLGPLPWLLLGRPRTRITTDGGAAAPPARWIPPDDNPEFLRSLGEANRARREEHGEDPTAAG